MRRLLIGCIMLGLVKAFLPPAKPLKPGREALTVLGTRRSRNPPCKLASRRPQRLMYAAGDVATSSDLVTMAELAKERPGVQQRFIFFGGKGGVGKTSTSTAMAVHMADQGLRTLIISTDPAHSLGDVLDQKVSGGSPVRVFGCDALWGMEVDTPKALANFREVFKQLDVSALASTFGVSEEILSGLGLEDFVGILNNPPPGIDELVALADVVKLAKGGDGMPAFDRIVIDTAPTGHTLRLLAFPDFLDGFLGKLVKLQLRVQQLLSSLSGIFGGGDEAESQRLRAADDTLRKIEEAKEKMVELRRLFRDQEATEFCIVTIPTQLAVAESKRLLKALRKEGVRVRHVVVNKLVQDEDQTQHLARIIKGQEHCLTRLQQGVMSKHRLAAIRVPFLDTEVRGVYGLKFLGDQAFGGASSEDGGAFADLFQRGGAFVTRFVLMGGKGGVGKTSSSAALAVKLADEGFCTAVVSTDPAHSLGDALDVDLSSGHVTEITGLPFSSASGQLFALEVDTSEAIAEFKSLLEGLGSKKKKSKGGAASGLMSKLELGEFAEVLDSAPPGSDELVALARVLKLLKEGAPGTGRKFDRVVIDTAPTGHTLRLLSFPEFLEGFLERIMAIRDRLKGASALIGMFQGGGDAEDGEEEEGGVKKDRIREFQLKMIELDDLLHDPGRCEFVVVTIPTELAVAETERLVGALKEQDVAVRRLIINQVLSPEVKQAYWDRMRSGQQVSLREVEKAAEEGVGGVRVTRVPYFDTELRTVYGLRVLADMLVGGGLPA